MGGLCVGGLLAFVHGGQAGGGDVFWCKANTWNGDFVYPCERQTENGRWWVPAAPAPTCDGSSCDVRGAGHSGRARRIAYRAVSHQVAPYCQHWSIRCWSWREHTGQAYIWMMHVRACVRGYQSADGQFPLWPQFFFFQLRPQTYVTAM